MRSITAVVPVSIRSDADEALFGNAIAQWFATTGSGIVDPAERVRAVTDSTRIAREAFEEKDRHLTKDWYDFWPLRRLYIFGLPAVVTSIIKRPAYNIVVSNVSGTARPIVQ